MLDQAWVIDALGWAGGVVVTGWLLRVWGLLLDDDGKDPQL